MPIACVKSTSFWLRVLAISRSSLVWFSILFSVGLYAQRTDKILMGKVVDELALPVTFATVSLHDAADQVVVRVITDSLGDFSIRYSKPGNYSVKIKHVRYEDYQTPPFEFGDINFGPIKLSLLENTLDEVAVVAEANVLEIDGGTITYHVANDIGGQDVSALDVLKRAPGVFVENESNITLHGKGGIQILLDGKQVLLSGNDLMDLLKSMSSNNIKSIAIINSPTARYDAAGSAGIIDIRTKKNVATGLNGSIASTVAYGVSPKQLQSMNLNYRLGKLNVFGQYNHTLGYFNYLYGTSRTQQGKSYDSHTADVDKRQKMSAQAGVDYSFNEKSAIGLLVNGNFILGGGITDTRTDVRILPAAGIEQSLDAVNDYYGQGTSRYNFNLNYKYEDTLGHALNIAVDHGLFDKWNKNLQSNLYRDSHGTLTDQNLYRTLNNIDINLTGARIDYAMKLWKGKFESGLKYTQVGTANQSNFYHVDLGLGTDSLDNRRSNDFSFEERISSAYIDYSRTMRKWSFQAGLRMERSDSRGVLLDRAQQAEQDEGINRGYTNLFPFLSISANPTAGQQLSFSYAKRIERPAYQDLNPFIYMLDELSFWQGNPFLMPSFTHRFTMLYSPGKSTVATFNFSYTDQLNVRITDTLDHEKIMMIYRNVGTQKHTSLSLIHHFTPKPWWKITFNGMIYHIRNDVAFDEHRQFDLQQLSGQVSFLQSFQLPFRTTAELSAMYHSNRLGGANTVSRAISQVDFAVQKSLMKNRATIRLAVSDLYKGNQSRYTQNFPGFVSSSYGYYESRQARLSFSYNFSSGESNAQRVRKSALESESGRIK